MAGFLSYGMAKGLSTEDKWEKKTENLYRQQAYAENIQQIKAEKVRQHAELTKEHIAVSPFYQTKLEGFYDGLNQKMGKFIIDNPDFHSDPVKYREYLSIANQYLDNEYVREDVISRTEIEKFRAAASKKGELSLMDIQKNEEAINAFNKEGIPYRFIADNSPTFENIYKEGLTLLNASLRTIDIGDWRKVDVDPGLLDNYVNSIMANFEKAEIIDRNWEDAGRPYGSPRAYFKAMLDQGIKKDSIFTGSMTKALHSRKEEKSVIFSKSIELLQDLTRSGSVQGNENMWGFLGVDKKSEVIATPEMGFMATDIDGQRTAVNLSRPVQFNSINKIYEVGGMIMASVNATINIPEKSDDPNYIHEGYYFKNKVGQFALVSPADIREIKNFKHDNSTKKVKIIDNNGHAETIRLSKEDIISYKHPYDDTTDVATLTKIGFKDTGVAEQGFGVINMGGDQYRPNRAWKGVIDIPVKFGTGNIHAYEVSMSGQAEANKMNLNWRIAVTDLLNRDQSRANGSFAPYTALNIVNNNIPTKYKFEFLPDLVGDKTDPIYLMFSMIDETSLDDPEGKTVEVGIVYDVLKGVTRKIYPGNPGYEYLSNYFSEKKEN